MVKAFNKPIYVSKPFLPPLETFCEGLKEIWRTRQLTNNGPLLQRFTRELSKYLVNDNALLV